MTTRRELVQTIAGVSVIGVLTGCSSSDDRLDSVEIQNAKIYDEPLTGFGFGGFVVNVSEEPVPDVVVEVEVFEGQDIPIQIDTVVEYIGELDPGQREEFAIPYEQDEYPEENLSMEARAIQAE
jgi:hypothetical protein